MNKEGKISNITLQYHTGIKLEKYENGTYYVSVYTNDKYDHIAFTGKISDISKVGKLDTDPCPKRKTVALLNNDEPLTIDLQILDNYMMNCGKYGTKSVTNLGTIMKFIDCRCTHVTISQMFPIVMRSRMSIKDVDIMDIYKTQ